jgi:hypothetical protein|tara:strand:+ start:621 stop:1196 length:576 start_codon:yes stop_codon:yes gene_type:complete
MLGQKKSISNKEDFIKSIDALFLKLELAYHYQFYKVFGTDEKLKEGKKLWAISLKDIAPEIILDAVENVISSQSYLPTLTDLMKACNEINRMDGFPSVEEAYVEARRSYQPRASYNWSHPIVYFVGKKIGWNIINEKDSKENFNTFKHIFNALKIQAIEGKEFKIKQSKVLNDRKPLNPDLFKKLREKHKV